MKVLGAVLFSCCAILATASFAVDTLLPPGQVFGGLVEDDGQSLLVLESGDSSFLVRLPGGRAEIIKLPGVKVRSLKSLADGNLLLSSLTRSRRGGSGGLLEPRGTTKTTAGGTISLDVVRLKRDEIQYLRGWSGPVTGYHYDLPAVSADGRMWALSTGDATLLLGRLGKREKARPDRFETVALGERVDLGKWEMGPDLVILDSEGPIVLSPWNEGAYVLHFAENGSTPYVLPILFGDGVEEYAFRWQWKERILWTRTSLYWKAYHLWDLGLSSASFDEPFWVVESASTEPHSVRGVVRVADTEAHGYRIEHLWRDPWSSAEERRVSDWYQGKLPSSFASIASEKDLFVSPNGRYAVVIVKRMKENVHDPQARPVRVSHARRVELRPAPRPPVSIDPDTDAEAARDGARLTALRRAQEAGSREEAATASTAESSAAELDEAEEPPSRP